MNSLLIKKISFLMLMGAMIFSSSTSLCMWDKTKNYVKNDKTWKVLIGAASGFTAGLATHVLSGESSLAKKHPFLTMMLTPAAAVLVGIGAHKYSGTATAIMAGGGAAASALIIGTLALIGYHTVAHPYQFMV